MSVEIRKVGERGTIEVDRIGDDVALEVINHGTNPLGYTDLRLTPGEAVWLSRALVKAAAEALGVSV